MDTAAFGVRLAQVVDDLPYTADGGRNSEDRQDATWLGLEHRSTSSKVGLNVKTTHFVT